MPVIRRPDLREQMLQSQQPNPLLQNVPGVPSFVTPLIQRLLSAFTDPGTSALPVGANIISRATGRVMRGMPKRSEKQIQAEVDAIETDLLKKGVDITKVFPAKQSINLPGFQQEPARLTRLGRQLDAIHGAEKADFVEAAISKTGLPRKESLDALKEIGFEANRMTAFFAEDTKRFGFKTAGNIENLYNHFADKKTPRGTAPTFIELRWGGTADNPQLISTIHGGGTLDRDVLRKVQAVYNAVAENLGQTRIDLLKELRLK